MGQEQQLFPFTTVVAMLKVLLLLLPIIYGFQLEHKVLVVPVLKVLVVPVLKKKCFVIFGKVVTKNTRWLSEDALIQKNARIAKLLGLPELLDRTLDDTEDTLVDRATGDD